VISVSYGAGLNSTAMLVGLKARGVIPDLITFADTGGERPETYAAIERMQRWLAGNSMPPIIIVRKVDFRGDVLTLERDCLNKAMLPSLAYGWKTCSQKYKIQPQDKYLNNHPMAKATWAAGGKVQKLIGYDAGEERRAKFDEDAKYVFRYPLIEWNWGRGECVAEVGAAGLGYDWPKSACFFCPSSTKDEIKALPPELRDRALAIEDAARPNLTNVAGLGRRFNWRDFLEGKTPPAKDQGDSCQYELDLPCGCYDGGSAEE
jgi:hypothetical protein